jgi:uncharacterized protein
MDRFLKDFVLNKDFPCVMAKVVARIGYAKHIEIPSLKAPEALEKVQREVYRFVDIFRSSPNRLSSFIVSVPLAAHPSFESFERAFWDFLKKLNQLDHELHPHDPRVGQKPLAEDFSYSLKSEAFFILALHPESPRLSRRFSRPTIVFNPHQQFENMRIKGIFTKVRDVIRSRDKKLQGEVNPMSTDYGERSEVFQYIGKSYPEFASSPL